MSEITVTQEQVNENMQDVIVRTLQDFEKPCTYVTVRMKNGFTLRESTTCVDPANYDESTYFGSKKVTEVREWYEEQIAAGKVKMLATTDSTVMTNDTFGMTHGVYSTQILSTDPAQMQSRIDSLLPKMEATINDNNAELKTLVK